MAEARLRVTILGCGSSGGVPRIGGHWGACDPAEPKNRRRRCSILVERVGEGGGVTRVLVDTSPDLREQLLAAEVATLDGVLLTHEHADQTHGLDDLRVVSMNARRRTPVWMDAPTAKVMTERFAYCFKQAEGSWYPAILSEKRIEGPVTVEGAGGALTATPFEQDHGGIISLGFRFGDMAYSSDLVNLDEAAFCALEGVKLWIVDALRFRPHPTHAHYARTLEWIARVRPERAVLTNLHIDLDYRTLQSIAPPGVETAYDGMVLELAA